MSAQHAATLWRLAIFVVVVNSPGKYISPVGALKFGGLLKKPVAVWGPQPLPLPCIPNAASLSTLTNLVCSTAQAINVTNRDACYGCFARGLAIPAGQPQMLALALCAGTYFAGTPYFICGVNLANTINNPAIFLNQNSPCIPGYCEFVQCLRSTNANNLIVQCSREVIATGVSATITDLNSVIYYSNMTSCILSKIRCGLFNPITGEPQAPGLTGVSNGPLQAQIPLFNSLQITPDGSLRVISIPGSLTYPPIFCSAGNNFVQSSWLNNRCP